MTLIALIPARRGSKGIPNKNLREFKGQPLIAWTINQALSSASIDRVIVSTEDEEIAEIAKKFGAEIPFLRPKKYSTSKASTVSAILHYLRFLKRVFRIINEKN